MNLSLLQTATAVLWGLSIFLVIAWLVIARRGFVAIRLLPEVRRERVRIVLFSMIAWLGLLFILTDFHFFENFSALPPRIAVAILPPVLLAVFLLFSPSLSKMLLRIPPTWLIGLQGFRIVMEIFIFMMYKAGKMPVQMTFEGFNFDILVGISAVVIVFFLKTEESYRYTLGFVWNAIGLVFLVTIVTIATLSTPSPFRAFMNEPSNAIVAQFPFIWIPGWIVPSAFALHLFSLWQLLLLKRKNR